MKLSAVLRAVHASEDDGRRRAADLIKVATDGDSEGGVRIKTERSNALADAFMEVAGDRGVINPRMLGRWIEKHACRQCEGMWTPKSAAVITSGRSRASRRPSGTWRRSNETTWWVWWDVSGRGSFLPPKFT
jgi:hypothetical protein